MSLQCVQDRDVPEAPWEPSGLCPLPMAVPDGVSARTHWCSPAQSHIVVGAGSCGTDWDPQEPDRAWSCSLGDAQ